MLSLKISRGCDIKKADREQVTTKAWIKALQTGGRAWGRQQRCRAQDRVCWKSSPRYDAWLALAQEVRPMACGVMPVLRAI